MDRKKASRNSRSSTAKLNQIRDALLAWFDANQRDLPWRRTRSAYAIWVAETMLQQTQVQTVLPYYRRFLRLLPTVRALDRAPGEKVLSLWSGLGYYRRAENLKRAARQIMMNHGGKLPRDFKALLKLPGIGAYTAGALMSIAFDAPYPAVDGNSRRVLSRLFLLETDKEVASRAKDLVAPFRPGHLNQALMDLAAAVCLARAPRCHSCPLARVCDARRQGDFPMTKRTRRTKGVEWPLALIKKNGMVLLRRRPRGGLLEGLWEVPGGERVKGEPLKSALERHLDGLGAQVRLDLCVGEIRHSITNRRIRAPLFTCSNSEGIRLPGPGWRWVPVSALHRYPLSSFALKAIRRFSELQSG